MTDSTPTELAAFTYDLPEEYIAQRPAYPYDSARMLIVDRAAGTIEESTFAEFHRLTGPRDLIVFNDTKVIPARHLFDADRTGVHGELLLLEEQTDGVWRCLARPMRRLKPGRSVVLQSGITGIVVERYGELEVLVRFEPGDSAALRSRGLMPIPPYIRSGKGDETDRTDYQPLLARREGSVAAPTASLHFTPNVMDRIAASGARTETLTLHLATASFLPVRREDGTLREPGMERLESREGFGAALAAHRADGGRIIAVGTSMVRAIESLAAAGDGEALSGTELFIRPGFSFGLTGAIVTNFHQPGTTHLLLVEAFLGRDLLEASYRYALERRFRFLSYGDGMIIV